MNERGFTLPELVAVTVFMLGILAGSLFLLAPKSYDSLERNTQRRLDVAKLAQSIRKYTAETGQLPTDIPASKTAIGSPEGQYDLCKLLVPRYLNDIPLDPVAGLKFKDDTETTVRCNAEGVDYGAVYLIVKNKDNSLTISAPVAESGQTIAVTIR